MSRSNRQKRLWNQIRRRSVTDSFGRKGVILTPPEAWLDMYPPMTDAQADDVLRLLRSVGVQLWLHPDRERGIVRTRMLFPPEADEQPTAEMVGLLQRYARALGKAVARSGDWNPPPGNPFGDEPLPPGGHWEWGD